MNEYHMECVPDDEARLLTYMEIADMQIVFARACITFNKWFPMERDE